MHFLQRILHSLTVETSFDRACLIQISEAILFAFLKVFVTVLVDLLGLHSVVALKELVILMQIALGVQFLVVWGIV